MCFSYFEKIVGSKVSININDEGVRILDYREGKSTSRIIIMKNHSHPNIKIDSGHFLQPPNPHNLPSVNYNVYKIKRSTFLKKYRS